MARLELNNSGIVFLEDTHQYFLDGIELSGITGAIQSQIAPDELQNIPEHILEKATQRGKQSHSSIEKFLKDWTDDGSQTVQDYIKICQDNNLCSEASEYLVTDYKDFASAIDCVFRVDDNTFDLADIKTYSKLDATKREKVYYQLSIYAYFFELVNPEATVRNLYVIHLRDTEKEHISELIPIPRIPSEICQKLLQCALEGSQFVNPYAIPQKYRDFEAHIRELIQTQNAIDAELKALKAEIMETMQSASASQWTTPTMKLTLKAPTTRSSFNLNLFKSDHPEFNYDDYMKTTQVSSSLMITLQ